MHKAISITIAGQIFYIEEDAYQKLSEYLDAIKQHFNSYEDRDEIISDIESRIAEKLTSKVSSKKQAVGITDIEIVIKTMGTVQDFEEFDDGGEPTDGPHQPSPNGHKKLYRDMDHAMLGGVCSGIANYFGIDPLFVRILLLVSLFLGGGGVIIYLILWLLIPEAKTEAQKSEMAGASVTLKDIEQDVRERWERIDTTKLEHVGRTVMKKPGHAVNKFVGFLREMALSLMPVFKFIIRFIFGIIGIAIIVAALAGLAVAGFAVANLLVNGSSPYVDFPYNDLFSGAMRYAAFASLFVIIAVPLLLIIRVGAVLVSGRKRVHPASAILLLSVWMIALVAAATIGLNKAPDIQARYNEITSVDNASTRQLDLADFTSINAGGAANVTAIQGDAYSVAVTGTERDLDRSRVIVRNGELVVEQKDDFRICLFCIQKPLALTVTAPEIASLSFSGASAATVAGFSQDAFSATLSGASRLDLSGEFTKIILNMSGASRADLTGSSTALSLKLSGASRVNAFDMPVADASINASGASRAELNASDSITASLSGASKVYYKGDAELIERSISGGSEMMMMR